jgi:hypothetical protein
MGEFGCPTSRDVHEPQARPVPSQIPQPARCTPLLAGSCPTQRRARAHGRGNSAIPGQGFPAHLLREHVPRPFTFTFTFTFYPHKVTIPPSLTNNHRSGSFRIPIQATHGEIVLVASFLTVYAPSITGAYPPSYALVKSNRLTATAELSLTGQLGACMRVVGPGAHTLMLVSIRSVIISIGLAPS